MGFNEVKAKVIACLRAGRIQHEERGAMQEKNLLAVGAITVDETIRLISRCRGTQHQAAPLTGDPSTLKHELKPEIDGEQWFIRFYFIDDDSVFISVHPSHHRRSR